MYARCSELRKAKEIFDSFKSRDPFTWTALIAAFVQNGDHDDALDLFDRMWHEGIYPNEVTFTCALKACGSIKAMDKGQQIHDELTQNGMLKTNVKLGNALVGMYAKCGALERSAQVLKGLPVRDVVSWTTLIAGYADNGEATRALHTFEEMRCEGFLPNEVTYSCLLKACGSMGALDKGKAIHDEIAKQGFLKDNPLLGNALLDMYGRCGALDKARALINELSAQTTITWNIMIARHADHDENEQALNCYEEMQFRGISPNTTTFASILKVCASIKAIVKGEEIHDKINKQGILIGSEVLCIALVDMYIKCDALQKAQSILEDLPVQNVISWNALITKYAHQGRSDQAFNCFQLMRKNRVSPDPLTYASILKVIGSMKVISMGENIHQEISKQGLLRNDVVLGTALVDMYAKCDAISRAHNMLEELPFRDVFCWTALITGYVEHGEGEKALKCFELMKVEGVVPNDVTFICTLKACSSIRSLVMGEEIRDEIDKQGLLSTNIMLGNALINMYAKCGALTKAREVLGQLPNRNSVSWNTIIAGYVENDDCQQALKCFRQMRQEGFSRDAITFASILKGCSSIGAADKGEKIHDEIIRDGQLADDIMVGTALLDMYIKCGNHSKALSVFEGLPVHDVVSWTALIAGFIHQGETVQSLQCFEQMQREGFLPNAATFSCLLNACGRLGLLEDAEMCFSNMNTIYATKPSIEHYSCMINAFGHEGHFDKAVEIMKGMPSFGIGLWPVLIAACKKWGVVDIGRWAFEQAARESQSDVSIYMLGAKEHMHEECRHKALLVE
ncbi:hypothetical protein KP509_32G042800 [Ceratopteris richardii]|nr:hypothetical protein KP509_32G042800 [Ceratopteris richardii]